VPETSQPSSAYHRFLPAIRLKCKRILAHAADAEDVAQESFIRLMQQGPRWSDDDDTPIVMA